MKKLVLLLFVSVLMTSCYNTRLYFGDVSKTEPMIEVNKEWNHGFIAGLVAGGNAKMKVEEYMTNAGFKDYMIKTNTSFLNGLVGTVTFGIYTPTQTKIYVPLRSLTENQRNTYFQSSKKSGEKNQSELE